MRFHFYIVILRCSGASGIGVLLGCAIASLFGLLLGRISLTHEWLLASPVLALLGAVFGLVTARLTRLWLVPHIDRRRQLFTIIGAAALPLAIGGLNQTAHAGPLAVGMVLLCAVVLVWLWFRGFQRELALVRQYRWGR
ncbi:hypothetical protein [Saccharopolyspora sp. 6V]|uniref:hypothetical protein n=1 Tax=Saccharopolyspora sp. 6V TaxID=2877239 RepID=UPI001CD212C9|nr:hypothetical protein [Saccharopolyspora sp. 6V]MCA1196275.1 hypothetical protein [Saccharopolyspora sp. 6V]